MLLCWHTEGMHAAGARKARGVGRTPEQLPAAAVGSLLTCSYSSRSERLTLGADSKASFSRISVRSLMVWLRKLPAQKGRSIQDAKLSNSVPHLCEVRQAHIWCGVQCSGIDACMRLHVGSRSGACYCKVCSL